MAFGKLWLLCGKQPGVGTPNPILNACRQLDVPPRITKSILISSPMSGLTSLIIIFDSIPPNQDAEIHNPV